MNRFFVCALVSLHAGPGFAQGAVDRALSAGSAVGGPEALMQESVIDDYVLPYETATPEEGGLSHVQFEDEVNEVREKDDAQGRALRSTEDGYAVRPDVDVDAQGPLFDDANWAHENADDVAGHYFSSETGTCETVALPVTEITDQFCSASPADATVHPGDLRHFHGRRGIAGPGAGLHGQWFGCQCLSAHEHAAGSGRH